MSLWLNGRFDKYNKAVYPLKKWANKKADIKVSFFLLKIKF